MNSNHHLLSGYLPAILTAAITFTFDPAAAQPNSADSNIRAALRINDASTASPMPCRVHLRNAAGESVRAPDLPFWHDHFVCRGEIELNLPPGRYEYTVERGPEYTVATGRFTLVTDPVSVIRSLRRLTDLKSEGWWSGETHVHRPLNDIELLLTAEDLHVATVTTWWNDTNPWSSQPLPDVSIRKFDENRFYDMLAGEDERGGGALLYFGLREPLPITGAEREFPPSTRFLQAAKQHPGAWVEIEKPFWWDTPIWLATGSPDAVGLAHNHLQRGGMLDNEAWGRARDRQLYPSAWGNGLWTQDIYYHILNSGLRLPPSAGSASGVLANPVGYNRVWVHCDGPLTWEKWWTGLRAGRAFVGNGPLLRVRANGQLPGHVFRNDEPLRILLEGQLDSRDPIDAVELIRNGEAERIILPHVVTLDSSGWFLVRAIAQVTNTFRFASTGPYYAEIAGEPLPVRRASAQFFLDWVRERKTNVTEALDDPAERAAALEPILAAERFWTTKVESANSDVSVTGRVTDAETGQPLPARLYIQHEDGRWFHPRSADPQGSALRYERQNWANTNAVEYHTTLSAHPFRVQLPPGHYRFTVERGKEWLPLVREVDVQDEPLQLNFPLQRWINMAERGWFSGDTHVHRTPTELLNLMLAEDLNVAFPLSYWVTQGFTPPTAGDKNAEAETSEGLIKVDDSHVIWARNTEYELFTLNGRQHTLGAFFVLGHSEPLTLGTPPVRPIFELAHRNGALLDLDKHDWPWSVALAVLGVDLYELANNHHWRTEFGITSWASPTPVPGWMQPPAGGLRGNEADWTRYTLETYYALLNCGFRLRPTAGTANGVHPVPLGFGRVYVHLPGGFSYADWLAGLNAGRSFVTTGPMLIVTLTNDRVRGLALSEQPISKIEILVNGNVAHTIRAQPTHQRDGTCEIAFDRPIELAGTSWVAARCFEPRTNGRMRFAHTAPAWFDDSARPLKPRPEQIEFLVQRVEDELQRSAELLPEPALEEYREALRRLQALR